MVVLTLSSLDSPTCIRCLDLHQEGTSSDDLLYAAVEALDGNVVVAGNTKGNWSDINDGWYDVAVAKLNADDGEVIWRYQVR